MSPKYGVRRFTKWRDDQHCFELYVIATGECASFPGTKKGLEKHAKERNAEASKEQP
jgi:hypothetical protein